MGLGRALSVPSNRARHAARGKVDANGGIAGSSQAKESV